MDNPLKKNVKTQHAASLSGKDVACNVSVPDGQHRKNVACYVSTVGKNIKLLRKRRSRTQDDIAIALNMKRSTLSGYENSVAEPGIEALLALEENFKGIVDARRTVDMGYLRESK